MQNLMTYNFNMKRILTLASLVCLWGLACPALAAAPAQSGSCPVGHEHMGHIKNIDAQEVSGIKKLTDAECSSCHGAQGISVSDNIPNLAGQDSLYLCGWLVGCRTQGDKCEGHEDIAAKFNDHEIVDLAEFYSHLPAVKW